MADWSDTGEAYAASFAGLCAGAVPALLDELDVRVPARGVLLDVGTGPGTVLATARARGWMIRASDAEASMVTAARARHPGVVIDQAALPSLPYEDGAFDAVCANFVLNHVPDAATAVRELGRVSSRAVAVTVWSGGASPLRPMWDAVLAAASVARPPERATAAPLGTPAALEALLRANDIRDVRTRETHWDFAIDPASLWHGVEGGVANIGAIYRALDRDGQDRLRRAYAKVTSEQVDSAGLLVVPHAAIIGSGVPH